MTSNNGKSGLLSELKCYVLPGSCPPEFRFTDQHNNAYRFWRRIYEKVYSDSKSLGSLNPDNFLKQDIVVTLVHKEQTVGCIFFSFHNLESFATHDQSYLADYTPEAIEKFPKTGLLMTMESLTVDPTWRKSIVGQPLSEVLLGFAMEVFKVSRAAALIGTPRKDIKMDRACQQFGCLYLGSIVKSNYPCEMMIVIQKTVCLHPDLKTQGLIKGLWSSRINTLNEARERYVAEVA